MSKEIHLEPNPTYSNKPQQNEIEKQPKSRQKLTQEQTARTKDKYFLNIIKDSARGRSRSSKREGRSQRFWDSPSRSKIIRTISTANLEAKKSFFGTLYKEGENDLKSYNRAKSLIRGRAQSKDPVPNKSRGKKRLKNLLSKNEGSSLNESSMMGSVKEESPSSKCKRDRRAQFEAMKRNLSLILQKINKEYENQILKNRKRWTPQLTNSSSQILLQKYKRAPNSDMNNPKPNQGADQNAFVFAQQADNQRQIGTESRPIARGSQVVPNQDMPHVQRLEGQVPRGGNVEAESMPQQQVGNEQVGRMDRNIQNPQPQQNAEYQRRIDGGSMGNVNTMSTGWQQQSGMMPRQAEGAIPQPMQNNTGAQMDQHRIMNQNLIQNVRAPDRVNEKYSQNLPQQSPHVTSQEVGAKQQSGNHYPVQTTSNHRVQSNQPPIQRSHPQPSMESQIHPRNSTQKVDQMNPSSQTHQHLENRHQQPQHSSYQNLQPQNINENVQMQNMTQQVQQQVRETQPASQNQNRHGHQINMQRAHYEDAINAQVNQGYKEINQPRPQVAPAYEMNPEIRKQNEQAYIQQEKEKQMQQNQMNYQQQLMSNYQNQNQPNQPQNLNTNIPEYSRNETQKNEQQKLLDEYTQICSRVLKGPFSFKMVDNKICVDYQGQLYDMEVIKSKDLEIQKYAQMNEYQMQQGMHQAERKDYGGPGHMQVQGGQYGVVQGYGQNYQANYAGQMIHPNQNNFNPGQYFRKITIFKN